MTEHPTAPTLAEVLLPLPLRHGYSYVVPPAFVAQLQAGMRVSVPFGRSKLYAGVVLALHQQADARGLKAIAAVLDEAPVLTAQQLKLIDWVAQYYMCTTGDVLRACLPAGLKAESEAWAHAVFDADAIPDTATDREYLVLEALALQQQMSLASIAQVLGIKNAKTFAQRLAARGWLQLQDSLQQRYQPRMQRTVALAEGLHSEAALHAALDTLQRWPKQVAALAAVAEAHWQGTQLTTQEAVARSGGSMAVLGSLVRKGLLVYATQQVDRVQAVGSDAVLPTAFTPAQQLAWDQLLRHCQQPKPKPVLLHGVTGSGKTFLYIQLIRHYLAQGLQALYLLPEIALTKQVVDRIRAAFGDAVGIYHSRFSDAERVEIWQKLMQGHYQVVVGARSAVLLPFSKLGVVVVDEEHDGSFKQQEPAPRYQARDVAIYLGAQLQIPVVLGSATPSLESYYNAQAGKYHLVELNEKATPGIAPTTTLVDMRQQVKLRSSQGLFSDVLLAQLQATLDAGQQAILFRNRRGYAPFLICESCGHIPRCLHCDISLTYHKQQQVLRCHYCGYTDNLVQRCTSCGHNSLRQEGMGTERLEEHLKEILPQARIARMDTDTMRGKHAFAQLITRFEQRQIDILVGTQMVTKGLDIPNVTLVAVVQADQMLGLPDFRATEQAYQLLMQLAGRAGRAGQASNLIIQTNNTAHPVFEWMQQPYAAFYENELALRAQHGYPPHGRLILIELRHKDRDQVQAQARVIGKQLASAFHTQVLGPAFPLVARLRGLYRMQFMIKLPQGQAVATRKAALQEIIDLYYAHATSKSLQIVLDIDPRS